MNRDEAIKAIRTALKPRVSFPISIKGGSGTAYGWIDITAAPRVCNEYGCMSDEHRTELAKAMGLDFVGRQGVSVASSTDHYREYVERAEGRQPTKIAERYWD